MPSTFFTTNKLRNRRLIFRGPTPGVAVLNPCSHTVRSTAIALSTLYIHFAFSYLYQLVKDKYKNVTFSGICLQ